MADITPITVPRDAITVTPAAVDYIYEYIDGHDVLSVLFDDNRLGAFRLLLTPAGARHIAAHLAAMCDQLPALRTRFNEHHQGEDHA